MTTHKAVTTERCGYILLIGLQRRANSSDPEIVAQLGTALSELEDTEELRCGVLFASGTDFASGPDATDELSAMVVQARVSFRDVDPFGERGRMRSKPVICAIQGRAGAWGTALALAQDAVVASENAVLTLSGRKVTAERALRIGLVHDVVPAETQLSRAFEIAIALGARR